MDNDGPGEKLALEAYQKLANASGKKIAGIASACYMDETGRFLHCGDANKQFLTISCPDNYEEVGNQGDHHEPWAKTVTYWNSAMQRFHSFVLLVERHGERH